MRKKPAPSLMLVLAGEAPAICAGWDFPLLGLLPMLGSSPRSYCSSGCWSSRCCWCWLWWGCGCGGEVLPSSALPPASPLPTARTISTTLPSVGQGSWLLALTIFARKHLTICLLPHAAPTSYGSSPNFCPHPHSKPDPASSNRRYSTHPQPQVGAHERSNLLLYLREDTAEIIKALSFPELVC